jgi:hypothetical protein
VYSARAPGQFIGWHGTRKVNGEKYNTGDLSGRAPNLKTDAMELGQGLYIAGDKATCVCSSQTRMQMTDCMRHNSGVHYATVSSSNPDERALCEVWAASDSAWDSLPKVCPRRIAHEFRTDRCMQAWMKSALKKNPIGSEKLYDKQEQNRIKAAQDAGVPASVGGAFVRASTLNGEADTVTPSSSSGSSQLAVPEALRKAQYLHLVCHIGQAAIDGAADQPKQYYNQHGHDWNIKGIPGSQGSGC